MHLPSISMAATVAFAFFQNSENRTNICIIAAKDKIHWMQHVQYICKLFIAIRKTNLEDKHTDTDTDTYKRAIGHYIVTLLLRIHVLLHFSLFTDRGSFINAIFCY